MLDTVSTTYQTADHDLLLNEGMKSSSSSYVMRVRDLPDDARPRERLANLGPSHLSLSELVAIILEVGSSKEDVLAMSRRIVKEYGEKALVQETNPRLLADALDIPFTKACRIVASLELGRRFYQQRAGKALYIRNAKQAYSYLKDIGHSPKELFRAIYLNSRYQVMRDEVISVGSLTANIVHPREVFLPALEHGAVAVILAHNHPSGSLQPSQADLEVTKQLEAAGKVLGIDLLDHLIITAKSFRSIKKEEL